MKRRVMTDAEMLDHLWKRCRHFESGDYFFFKKALTPVVAYYKKPLSKKQRVILVGYFVKYGKLPETPKPKKKSQLNPHQ